MEDTIVSISSPIGRGAIAIVRMSGPKSLTSALNIFHSKEIKNKSIKPRYMYLGKLQLDKETYEECLMVYFKGPNSFTGEDIIEFQIHGGVLLAQKVLERCLKENVRLAEPGEFSKRAFLNEKITLDKAEAIIGEINAETEGELKSSLQVTNGKLSEEIFKIQEELKLLLAEIEVGMDYPEETEETKLKTDIFKKLTEIKEKNKKIIENSQSMKYLKNGINVALVGKTNVGKSSIMNALLGENRSIVTDIQGTTRDSVNESFIYKTIKINLIDTAGIRQTKDIVENLGIEKSKQALQQADVILFILDGSKPESKEDREIENLLKNKNLITVINKSDKKRELEKKEDEISVSAITGENIESLKQRIIDLVINKEIDFNTIVLTNERQYSILEEANKSLSEILDEKVISLDILAMQIKKVWKILGKITGNTENEDIIDLIFSKFCLGK